MKTSGKYVDLWIQKRDTIRIRLRNVCSSKQSIQLNPSEFKNAGNRKRYAFNLEFIDGVVSNNIDGSAVARDLAKALESSKDIRDILSTGHYKINMDKHFYLWLEKL